MIKVNKLKKFFILFLVVFVCVGVLTFYNTQTAFADVDSEQSSDELGAKDYEDYANEDRLSRTTGDSDTCEVLLQKDGYTNLDHVWHVTNKEWLTSCSGFRTIHTYIDGQDYPFDYHIRGYFGDRSNVYGRKAHVQFFYNENTKTLRILCFGNNIGYDYCTYQYNSGTSILEDELNIFDTASERANESSNAYIAGDPEFIKQWIISKEVEHIEIDPRLQEIKKRGFQNSPKLIDVDVIGQRYDLSQLRHISSYAFRNCSGDSSYTYHGVHYIKFQLFNIYDRKKAQLRWDDDYAAGSCTHYYPQ